MWSLFECNKSVVLNGVSNTGRGGTLTVWNTCCNVPGHVMGRSAPSSSDSLLSRSWPVWLKLNAVIKCWPWHLHLAKLQVTNARAFHSPSDTRAGKSSRVPCPSSGSLSIDGKWAASLRACPPSLPLGWIFRTPMFRPRRSRVPQQSKSPQPREFSQDVHPPPTSCSS